MMEGPEDDAGAMREIVDIQLETDDGAGAETVAVEPLAGEQFRLEVTPVFANLEHEPFYANDVVELEMVAAGVYRFVRVVERAPLQHFDFLVPEAFARSPECRAFCDDVIAVGGGWERVFGGLLYVHVPVDSPFDVAGELKRWMAAARPLPGEGTDG
jgi:hypothetical protein